MMRTPPRRSGLDADRPEGQTARTGRTSKFQVESLEGRDLLATFSAMVLPSPIVVTTGPVAGIPAPIVRPEVTSAQFEPLTGRILVQFNADPAGYNPAVLMNPANYEFKLVQGFEKQPARSQSRPKAGIVLPPPYEVTGVTLANPLEPASVPSVIVSINNNEPLRFGVYQFTVKSTGLVDAAGRTLDGQFNGTFPSGNGQAGDFVAILAETNSTVLPALSTSGVASANEPGTTTPAYVFFPTSRAIRVRYTSAKPGGFMLAGGNKITLRPLAFQHFPGSYRLPKLDPTLIPGLKSSTKVR